MLDWSRANIISVVHDEILVEVDEEIASEIVGTVEQVMKVAFLDVFPGQEATLKNLVEAKIGHTWKEAK